SGEPRIAKSRERGMDRRDRRAGLAPAGRDALVYPRVLEQETQQLAARISGGADDRDFHREDGATGTGSAAARGEAGQAPPTPASPPTPPPRLPSPHAPSPLRTAPTNPTASSRALWAASPSSALI